MSFPRKVSARILRERRKAKVAERVARDDRYLYDLVQVLLRSQTAPEQRLRESIVKNKRGLTKADAMRLTEIALKAQKRGFLRKRELRILRKPNKRGTPRIAKYWRQAEAVDKKHDRMKREKNDR